MVSPPKISEDCPASFRNNLEIDLRDVGVFLHQHFSSHSKLHPVEFYSDYFKRPISDIDVKRLHAILAPVPTAIIYSDISDYQVSFHIGFWEAQSNNIVLVPVQAWDWEQAREKLEAARESQQRSLRLIRQAIVTVHKLLAAFLTDIYYLSIDPNYKLQLVQVELELPQEWVKPYIDRLKDIQQERREAYEQELKRLAEEKAQREVERKRQQQQRFLNLRCVHTFYETGDVSSVVISPDSQYLASNCDQANSFKIWNLNDRKLVGKFHGHSNAICSLAFSPDGKILASGSGDRTIKLWEVSSGKLICTLLEHSGSVLSLAFSPDGKILASGSADKTIKLWQVSSGKVTHTLKKHSDFIRSVVIDSNGQTLAAASDDRTISTWQIESGKLLHCSFCHSSWVYSVAFSSQANFLASGSMDNTIKLWELKAAEIILTLSDHSGSVFCLASSPSEQIIVSGSADKTIKFWDLNTSHVIRTLSDHSGPVLSLALSASGETLVSGSGDKTIKIWQCK